MFLKQSTTTTVSFGPFVSATDGKTPVTDLYTGGANAMTVYLSKNGGTAAARNSATSITYDRDGYYRVELNTTDTGTAGLLEVFANATGALPVWRHLVILTANNYDALIAGSDALQVHANEITANLITAAVLATDAGAEIATAVWANAARTLTASLDPNATSIAAAVWNALRADHTAAGSFGQGVASVQGNITGSVASVTSPVTAGTVSDKTGYALSAAGVSAVQSGLSTLTAAQVKTEVDAALSDVGLTTAVTGRIDAAVSSRLPTAGYTVPANADVAAIKAQTDKLAFAGAGPYDVKATLDGEPVTASSVSDKTGYSLSAAGVTAVQSGLSTLTAAQVNAEVGAALAGAGVSTTVMGRLDAAVSTRLAAAAYTAPANSDIAAIKARTDLIPETPAAAGSAMTLAVDAVDAASLAAGALGEIAAAVWAATDRALSIEPPAAAAIAAAVWDANLNDHNSPSTAGNKLNAASAAGDPWTASLEGYGAGSAGHLLATNLNATVSSRASHTAADTATAVWSAATRSLANDGNIAAIKAKTDLIVANGATAAQLQPAAEAAVLAQLANIAVEIHNTNLSQIAAPGNAAQALVDAAIDPWARADLSGYAEGSAGKLLATNLNAPVGSRSSHSAADAATAVWSAANRTLANDATQAAIKAKTDLIVTNGAAVADLTPAATTAIQNARLHQLMTAAFAAPVADSLMARLLEPAGGSWRFTAGSLAQTPAVPPDIDETAIATAVWQASMNGWLEGTMGYRITQDQAATEEIAAAVWATSLLPYNQSNSAGKALRDSTAFPTAGQIASNVWEIDPATFAALNGTMGHRLSSLTPAAVGNAVWGATQSAFQTPGTFGYLFDAPVSGQPGYTDGTGAVAFTYTLASQSDGSPIAGVRVTASDDIAGSHVIAEAISNAGGVVIFHLDAGRYYLWREKPGWSFVDPDIQDVEG